MNEEPRLLEERREVTVEMYPGREVGGYRVFAEPEIRRARLLADRKPNGIIVHTRPVRTQALRIDVRRR